jgi:type II secretory pathway component PulJ
MAQERCTETSVKTPQHTLNKPEPALIKNREQPSSPSPFFWQEEPYNPVKGEMALWTAVITQALMDALSRSPNKEAQFHKHEAIRWLTENSKDFIEVCHNAGLNPDNVRRKAKKVIANPTLWRAEAGKGKRYLERKRYRLKCRQQKTAATPTTEIPSPVTPQVIEGPWG